MSGQLLHSKGFVQFANGVQKHKKKITWLILALLCSQAYVIRLFAVIRYESVIHEFDPYFNFRTTKFLTEEGMYQFWNWFDDGSWYPLGRVIGQTLFPGLMTTAYIGWWFLKLIGFPTDVREICVFTAPAFSAFTTLATFLLTYESTGGDRIASLFAAFFIATSPTYISRSVAGSYDNEAIAIFTLVLCFYAFIRAVNRGTIWSAVLASLCYIYMVAAWGGYIFVINTISIFVFGLTILNRLETRHFIAYCNFYIFGTLLCLNIPFVNFQAVQSSEHMASHGVFLVVCSVFISRIIGSSLSPTIRNSLTKSLGFASGISFLSVFIALTLLGKTRWAGRSMTLLDPTFASKYIPIIASVAEHQPPTWTSYFFDLHVVNFFFPIGILATGKSNRDGMFFNATYGVLAVYFSSVMIRLMLILSPAACVLGGIGASHVLLSLIQYIEPRRAALIFGSQAAYSSCSAFFPVQTVEVSEGSESKCVVSKEGLDCKSVIASIAAKQELQQELKELKTKKKESREVNHPQKNLVEVPSDQSSGFLQFFNISKYLFSQDNHKRLPMSKILVFSCIALIFKMLLSYVQHCTFCSSAAYSHPSIVISQSLRDGSRYIQDDFREAYSWFRHNTHPKARIMSWWDYGYQSCTMGNRTVITDNNTWNNTHIATTGLAFASEENEAWDIVTKLDVDYVFVVFGGASRYSGDDLNKFLWMVRIAGGIYPWINEKDYLTDSGKYSIGPHAPPNLTGSLMYKLSFYKFNKVDNVRQEKPVPVTALARFEEAYTTENWLVRIYKVKEPYNRLPLV